jgi:hypothetical protein
MRRLMASLKTMDPGASDYDVAFMSLMRTIIHHVADEETMLLPEAERALADRLEELGWAMTKRRMELAGPRAGELAMNTARAYPMLVATVVAAVAVGGYLAWRGFGRSPTDVAASRWRRDVATPARKMLDRSIHSSSRFLDRPARFLERSARAAKRPAKRLLSYVH